MTLALRYVGIPHSTGEVPGLCVSASSEREAHEFFELVHAYITASGPKQTLVVKATGRTDRRFDITFDFGPRLGKTEIWGVDATPMESLLSGMASYQYFVVLAGYDAGDEFEMLDPSKYHLFKGDLLIDGRTVYGQNRNSVDWHTLLKG